MYLKIKNMKKLLTIAVAFSLFTISANAQVQRNASPSQKMQNDSTHRRGGKMMKDLNLTDAQKTQMKESRENMKQQRDAINNDASLNADQKKAKMQELGKTQRDKMNSILTPDQKAKMQADRTNWQGQKGMRGQDHGGKIMKDLNLTDAQKTQMKANSESMKQQREAISNDASLSQDQKKAKMQELHKTQKDQMNSILTADQKAKMKADMQNRKGKNGHKWNKDNSQKTSS
jgi:Spy/CpxP family protein refolding chaperone